MNDNKAPKIRVLIRKRPMNKKQQSRNETDIITIENNQTVIVQEQKLKVDLTPYIDQYRFNFDGAYDQYATNQQIYTTAIRPLVDSAFDGAKVSCFAYGQTGSGKTYTMLGNGSDVKGLYLLAAIDIFNEIKQHKQIQTWISFYQIYCGKLYDLLNEKNLLFARQDAKNNVNIVGLSQTKLYSAQNLMQLIQYGTSIRVTSQNGTNNDSSRSHAILQITLKKNNKIHGKISFIDLAGSQRAADHADQLQKQTRIDGAQINKSLLALKQCIRALDQNKHHTPFRGSKLTMVLKDSFTGYCRTVMIGNISPNSSSSQNTLNTLKYADRVKQLKKPNKQSFLQMEKIDQLEKQLMLPRNGLVKKSSKNFYDNNNNGNNNGNNNIQDKNEQQTSKRTNNSYRQNINNINSNHNNNMFKNNNSNMMKKQHYHAGYQHNKLPMNKKVVGNNNNLNNNNNNNIGNDMSLMGQNNSSMHHGQQQQQHFQQHYQQQQRPVSYQNMRKRSPTTQQLGQLYKEGNYMSDNNQSQQQQQQRRKSSNNVMQNHHTSPYQVKPPVRHPNNQPITKNSLIQQSQPFFAQKLTQKELHLLSQKHDQYVQLILQQQQSLLKHHQHHINSIIQLTKKQMTIKSQADKIGSRIQDYLQNLTQVLDNKLQSIFELKQRIQKIKQHILESKQLQEKYLIGARYMGLQRQDQGQDNVMLLDDDDDLLLGGNQKLFIN